MEASGFGCLLLLLCWEGWREQEQVGRAVLHLCRTEHLEVCSAGRVR